MINIEGITKYFNRNSAGEILALDHVSLNIHQGEFLVLLGANGSGKSTLLNAIAGTFFPDQGCIKIDDEDITGLKEHKRSRWISRVFQNPVSGTAPELTILENFRMAHLRTRPKTLHLGTGKIFREQTAAKIKSLGLGLENKLDVRMGTLSGGQRQSLTLLMSVMDDTRLLLMDEPTSALDPRTSELVMNLAARIISDYKLTAILVTHQIRDAVRFGNRIIQMSEGKIVKDLSGEDKLKLSADQIFSWF